MINQCAVIAFLAAVTTMAFSPSRAQTIDPHAIYEQKCGGCHGSHAGEFVGGQLRQAGDAVIVSRNRRDLMAMLAAGHGRLNAAEIGALIAHFTAILRSDGLFREKCKICHGAAVALARLELELSDGRLVGRYTDRDIATFLENHGRLETAEIVTIVEMFVRQLGTRGF